MTGDPSRRKVWWASQMGFSSPSLGWWWIYLSLPLVAGISGWRWTYLPPSLYLSWLVVDIIGVGCKIEDWSGLAGGKVVPCAVRDYIVSNFSPFCRLATIQPGSPSFSGPVECIPINLSYCIAGPAPLSHGHSTWYYTTTKFSHIQLHSRYFLIYIYLPLLLSSPLPSFYVQFPETRAEILSLLYHIITFIYVKLLYGPNLWSAT